MSQNLFGNYVLWAEAFIILGIVCSTLEDDKGIIKYVIVVVRTFGSNSLALQVPKAYVYIFYLLLPNSKNR